MMQQRLPAVFMRGGTSNGLIFKAADLPADRKLWDAIFLAAMGSPDGYGRQLNGMGGGLSSLSKVCVIEPATVAGADLDFTFAQVAVGRAEVDYSGNCGNMSSAVGVFALDEAMLPSGSWDHALDAQGNGEAVVRIHNTNTAKIVVARFPCRDGKAALAADCPIPGVSGAGVPVALCFLDPGGIYGNGLLPTGQPTCQLSGPEGIVASLIDSAAAGVFLRAGDFGLRGTESPEELEANQDLLTRLEVLRQQASVLMGVTASTGKAAETQAAPKIALVAPAQSYIDISGRAVAADDYDFSLRMISMGDPHRAVPLTGGLCAATGARIPGSLLAEATASHPDRRSDPDWVRIGTPSGVMRFAATVALGAHGNWNVSEARVERSTRRLMEGQVLIPAAGQNGPNDDKKDITS